MLRATLIETMDLSGPKFIATFDDPYSILRDGLGLKRGDELRITIADIYERDGIDETLDFKILTMPNEGNQVQINAISSIVLNLKTRAIKGRIFNKKTPAYIMGQLFKGCKIDATGFPLVENYHLLAGEYPSYLLREMAIEQGAYIFLNRGSACLYRITDIMNKKEPDFTYYNDNYRNDENQIKTYSIPSSEHILEDKLLRRYCGWSMINGWQSVGDANLAFERSSSQSKITMKNLAMVERPAIDFTCEGNGFVKAGSCIDFVWKSKKADAPIDESLPERAVVHTVAHHYEANKYTSRIKGIVPLEKTGV